MAILSSSQELRSAAECVAQMSVEIEAEKLGETRSFYARILGLEPLPQERQIPGGWLAGDARRQIYFQFCHDPVVDPARRRLTIAVNSLKRVEKSLTEAQWSFEKHSSPLGADTRLMTRDPCGHRIEIRQNQRW